jgi:alpha-beta hydrolase superfamily lysophospholipase
MRRCLGLLLGLVLSACAPVVIPAGPVTTQPVLARDALVMPDGARLPLHAWLPEGPPRAVILGLHGMNDAAQPFFADAAPLFTPEGVALYAYDQRGFGGGPHRGIWAGGPSLAADATQAVRLLRARHPGVPIFMLGESMGGAVALLAGSSADPPPVDGYILMAPALWGRDAMPGAMRGALWLAARTMPIVGFHGSAGGLRASDNDAALERWARHPLTIKVTRVDAAYGLLRLMDEAVGVVPACCAGRDGAPVPVLVLVGERDTIVPQPVARRVLRSLPQDGLDRVVAYPDGWHLLLRDLQRGVVARDILAWMPAPWSAMPSGADRAGAAWLARP